MTSYEKAEIQRLPRKYRPLSAWGYLFLSILYAIPVIGWICLVVHAFSDKNIVRRSYAKCYFWVFVITVIAVVVAAIVEPTLIDKVKGLLA